MAVGLRAEGDDERPLGRSVCLQVIEHADSVIAAAKVDDEVGRCRLPRPSDRMRHARIPQPHWANESLRASQPDVRTAATAWLLRSIARHDLRIGHEERGVSC